MSLIPLKTFLKAIEDNVNRTNVYKLGGDGTNGECDCIGLIVGGKRLCGGKWTGLHGSNYAARFEMTSFAPIAKEKDFFLGEIVFKAKSPNDEGYELPDRYKNGGSRFTGDLTDYYHVGIVTSVKPLTITHCTTVGPIVRDHEKRRWAYGGMLKGIDYSEIGFVTNEVNEMVTVAGGNAKSPINMRERHSVLSPRIAEIPQNSEVELLEAGTDWSYISYGGKNGYVMTKFIQSSPEENTATGDTILVDRATLEQAYDIIGDLLGLRG